MGLAFKPKTDDIRESPSIKLIKKLLKNKKIIVEVFDPVAENNTKKIFKDSVKYSTNLLQSTKNKDIIIVMTKWEIFKGLNNIIPKNSNTLIIDPRRFLNKNKFKNYSAFGIS